MRRFIPFAKHNEPKLKVGDVLTPHAHADRDVIELPSDPSMIGFLLRLNQSSEFHRAALSRHQRKWLLLGYQAGWHDLGAIVLADRQANGHRVNFQSASPMIGGRYV